MFLSISVSMHIIHIRWKFNFESFQILINPSYCNILSGMLYTISHIQITTKDGWLSIPEESVALKFKHETCCLHMTTSLNTEVPPI